MTAKAVYEKGNLWFLGFLCFIAALGGFLFGFDTAVISGAVSFVKRQFMMSAFMEGWFVSSALLGCIVGVAFSGSLSDHFGRKKVMILSSVMFFITGLGCALAGSQNSLILYRFIGGIGVGIASMICPLYISEFSPPRFRGALVAFYQLAITIGIVVAYFSNAGLQKLSMELDFTSGFFKWIIHDEVWRSMLGMNTLPALLFFVLLMFIPESPRWLTVKEKPIAALILLSHVGGRIKAQKELDDIRESLKTETGNVRQLLTSEYRFALIIGIGLALISQFSGINAVIYYGPRILDEAGFKISDALGGQVVIGIVNVVFTVVAILTVDKWGRRKLLITGLGGIILALAIVGFFFTLNLTQGLPVLIAIMVYTACFSFSLGPVTWVFLSEIYPTSIRGRAMSIGTLSIWVGCFIVGQLTPVMLDNLGPSLTFWVFALLMVPGLFIAWKVLPETKGKSLEEIEAFWQHRAKKVGQSS